MEHQITLSCIHCQCADLVKFGFAPNGTQRYRCNNKECSKTFMASYQKEAYKPGVKEKITAMALDGVGLRATSRLLKVAPNTIISTLRKKTADR